MKNLSSTASQLVVHSSGSAVGNGNLDADGKLSLEDQATTTFIVLKIYIFFLQIYLKSFGVGAARRQRA